MATLDEMLAKRTPDSRKIIKARVKEIQRELTLAKIREELHISQTQLATSLGVKQPAIAKMERVDNDLKISTLKRYVDAIGGKLAIDIILPNGEKIALNL